MLMIREVIILQKWLYDVTVQCVRSIHLNLKGYSYIGTSVMINKFEWALQNHVKPLDKLSAKL